jgi:hypothetical protein
MPSQPAVTSHARGTGTRSTLESRPGATITVRRIEVTGPIKAAISARIGAAKHGGKVRR